MNRIAVCLLVLFIAPVIHGQRRTLTKTQNQNVRSLIRQVDFRNFTYKTTSESNVTVVLRNGRSKDVEARCESELESVKYVDFDGDGDEEALVAINTDCEVAGALWNGDYFVFAYRNGAPVQIFHESSLKPEGIRVAGKSLIITAPFWRDNDAGCCPSANEILIYRWRGQGFVRVSRRLVPRRRS
jgi:hypothetical protein